MICAQAILLEGSHVKWEQTFALIYLPLQRVLPFLVSKMQVLPLLQTQSEYGSLMGSKSIMQWMEVDYQELMVLGEYLTEASG